MRPVPSPILTAKPISAAITASPATSDTLSDDRHPPVSTHLHLFQRVSHFEQRVDEMSKEIDRLRHELKEANRMRADDPFYYVAPATVLPPVIMRDHQQVVEMISAYTILYREQHQMLLHNSGDSDQKETVSATLIRHLKDENQFLRAEISRLMSR